jgi:hypothetical protein
MGESSFGRCGEERVAHPGRVNGVRKVQVVRRPYGGSDGRSAAATAEVPAGWSVSIPAGPDEPLRLDVSAGGFGTRLPNSREPAPSVAGTVLGAEFPETRNETAIALGAADPTGASDLVESADAGRRPSSSPIVAAPRARASGAEDVVSSFDR